jgi:hypothetical protein
MLIHMTPDEVGGLQALALKHGGSLTINPETGLPEAKFLKKLLPMIAGLALGPAGFGLMSAGMAGLTVGGVTALTTGSLSKGLQAGLGAYGGASLGEAFMGAGTNAATTAGLANYGDTLAAQGLQAGTPAYGEAASRLALESQKQAMAAPLMDKLSAGFNAVTDSPAAFGNFAKQNVGSLLTATSPMMADQGVETVTKMNGPAYIQNFDYDPMTQRAKALNPVSLKSLGYPGYADGGLMHLHRKFAEGGAANVRDGSSEAAYNYLMGLTNTTRPDVELLPNEQPTFYIPPATTTSMTTTPVTGGGGGGGIGGGGGGGGGASVGNAVSNTDPSTTYSGFQPAPPNPNIPVVDIIPTPVTSPDEDFPSTYPEPVTPSPDEDFPSTYPEPVTPSPDEDFPSTYPEPVMPSPDDDFPSTYPEPVMPSPDVDFPATYPEPVMPSPDVDFPSTYPEPSMPSMPSPDVDFPSTYFEPVMPSPDADFPSTAVDPYYSDTTEEVQDWQNVDNSGYYEGSMAGDNSLNSGNNTYTGETDSVQQQGLPDAFGSYPSEPTYIGNFDGGGYDGFIGDEDNIDEDSYDYQGMATGGMVPGYADGGVSGSGSLDLHVPINIGGGGGGAGGYTPVGGGNGMTSTPNVNPNANGGFGGGLAAMFGGGGRPQNGFGGMPQGLAGLFGNSGFAPQGFMGQMQQMDDMDMYSHAPNPFMEVPAVQNYQDVIRGRSNMLSGMGGTAQNGYMSPGGMGGYNPFTGRPSENNIAASFHSIQSTPSFGGTFAQGGSVGSHLGGYSDGGRLLRGPGDGVSDSIPASIGKHRQPARLADGEFVVPARIVSELGNGSTEAGARKLYAMMDRIQAARRKTVGKGRVAKNSRAEKYLPA